jgi:hypothetical protein
MAGAPDLIEGVNAGADASRLMPALSLMPIVTSVKMSLISFTVGKNVQEHEKCLAAVNNLQGYECLRNVWTLIFRTLLWLSPQLILNPSDTKGPKLLGPELLNYRKTSIAPNA